MGKQNGDAKWRQAPPDRKPIRIRANPENTDKQSPAWQFHKRDREHPEWGWDKLSHEEFCTLVHQHLAPFETMTWAEILSAVGDKKSGNKHHNIPVEDCEKPAQKRLAELKMDDYDQIFSLRVGNLHRLWGINEGRVLRFIWDDQKHTICPKNK